MTSAVTVGRIKATHDCPVFLHVPNSTSATLLGDNSSKTYLRATRDIQGLRVVVSPTAVTTGVTKVEIVAVADGAGTGLTVVKDSGALTLDVVNENYSLEVTADEINQAVRENGVALPWVTVRITCGNSSDRCVVAFLAFPIRFGGITGAGFTMGVPAYNTDYLASS